MNFTILLLAVLFSTIVFAEEKNCQSKLYLTYVNGVLNSRDDAQAGLEAVSSTFSEANPSNLGLRWAPENIHLVYNESNGLLDLLEAFIQKRGETIADFWKWIGSPAAAELWFQEKFTEVIVESLTPKGLFATNLDLRRFLDDKIITEGARILVVAHSQGNFFANHAIRETRASLLLHWEVDKKKAGLVSIATPASRVEGGGSYTTLESDGLIRAIPRSLPANVSNSNPTPGILDHELIRHYFAGDASRPQINQQMKDEARKLGEVDGIGITQVCREWFKSQTIGAKDGCYSQCISGMIDMGTMECHSQCAELCRCVAGESSGDGKKQQ